MDYLALPVQLHSLHWSGTQINDFGEKTGRGKLGYTFRIRIQSLLNH